MENIGNESQNTDSASEIEHLTSLINSQNAEIENLNNKINDIRRLFYNQLNDIERISTSNGCIMTEFATIKEENKQLETLQKENKQLEKKVKNYQKILNSYNDNFKLIFYLYDLKPTPFLKNIQDICQEVLDFVVNVCEKHELRYWLDAGTLLGAVRHDGFLPWDDDIDLGMMRKEYNRFQKVFDIELKKHGLQKAMRWKLLKNKENVLYFIQVSYAGFAILDIFPYDYAIDPPENMEELYFIEKARFKSNIKNGKSYSQAVDILHKNLNLSFEKQDYVVSGVEKSTHGPFCLQCEKEMFPLSNVTFYGKQYHGLKDNDAHLTALFGDWRKLPKVLARHNRIYKIKERPNINEFLVKKVNKLREINKNFK